MSLAGADILQSVRLGLASPTLAPSRPNLPVLKIESNPSNRFQCEVNCSWLVSAQELLADLHALEEEMLSFERKYGVRSEIFFAAYAQGEEPENEAWVLDFTEWASVYRTWLARQAEYRNEISRLQAQSPSLAGLVRVLA
jgi:hypothetical protein